MLPRLFVLISSWRRCSASNLLDLVLLIAALAISAGAALSQDPPPEPIPELTPGPTPALELSVPEVAPAHTLVRVQVVGVELKPTDVLIWDVVSGAKFLQVDQVEQLPGGLIFTGPESPEPYRVRLGFVRDGVVQRVEAKVLIGRAPQPPPGPPTPPPAPTLRDLAGEKAAALAAMYGELLAAVEGGLFDDVAHFQRTETLALEKRSLVGHGAAREIAKRLAVKSLDDLKAPLAKIVEELGPKAPGPNTPGPTLPGPADPATAAVYVYEKDRGTPPPPVLAALDRINRERKIRATTFEQDTVDGEGEVPDQYQAPLIAAQETGLPALVVMAGNKVLKVVKAPQSEQQVMEAIP